MLLLYLDDIVVIGPDLETHLSWLEEVLCRLQAAGFKLKPSNCTMLHKKVRYLDHLVSEEGVATNPNKLSAVETWPTLRNLKD